MQKPYFKKEKKTEAPKPPEETPAARVVKMYRSEEDAKGGPVNAEVHPSEVENYKAAGWKTK